MGKKHRCKDLSADPDFMEALNENGSSERQAQRKTQQFCRQVQRALNAALVPDLFVDEVSPAPDCGRLLVRVLIPGDAQAEDVWSMLAREKARLRAEVASAITRKRAPELCFVPAHEAGGDDE